MLQDFSQSGEQAVILEHAAELPIGRFLDIGAGDGETYSNTRALALDGWGGIAVEPAAWAFDRLVKLYGDDDAVACVSAIVTGKREGLQTFLYSKNDHLSTTVEAEAEKWPTVPFRRVFAASVDLSALLNDLGGCVTVVSIDAEGRTGELVEALMRWSGWAGVQVLCHEHCELRGRDPQTTRKRLLAGMEMIASTPNNVIWRRR